MIIAIDFDGTIADVNVEDGVVVGIGSPLPEATDTIVDLYEAGHELILWTCRTDILHKEQWHLKDAIDWLRRYRIMHCFKKFNEQSDKWLTHPIWGQVSGRKLYADIYIDDKNFGGFPGWASVRKALL